MNQSEGKRYIYFHYLLLASFLLHDLLSKAASKNNHFKNQITTYLVGVYFNIRQKVTFLFCAEVLLCTLYLETSY